MVRESQLSWWYGYYNRRFFGGRLERPYRLRFGNCARGNVAETTFLGIGRVSEVVDIVITRRIRWSFRLCLHMLLHEMVHVAQPRAKHGEGFKREMWRLFRAGAFEGLI